jgi:histidinol phosphatase-like enzyme
MKFERSEMLTTVFLDNDGVLVIPHNLTQTQDFSKAAYRAKDFADAVKYCMSISMVKFHE